MRRYAPTSGLIGRMVMVKLRRDEIEKDEPCEVVACQAVGEHGSWRVLVATHDGRLIDATWPELILIADPDNGPYR